MGRPPLPPGTYGEIKTRELPSGGWEARAQWRGPDGKKRRPACRGATKTAAVNALRKKLTKMVATAAKGGVTRETRFRDVVNLWLKDLAHQEKHEAKSHNTARTYRSYLKQQILPRIGALQLQEITGEVFDSMVKDVRDRMGYESAKKVRSITSAICRFAIRRGANDWFNPVQAAEPLAKGHGDQVEVTAMTADQISKMLDGLRRYAVTREKDSQGRRVGTRVLVWHDLPELAEAMLATGVRIGEVCAMDGDDVTKDDEGHPAVWVRWHLVRITGEGMARISGRKGGKPGKLLRVPDWSVAMFARRKLASGGGPLFTARDGGWLDQSNTASRLRAALDESGFAWVTSHVWRHTVGTLLDEAGLSVGEIADQLGNTRAVAEKHYIKPRVTNTKAAAALESIKPAKAAGN